MRDKILKILADNPEGLVMGDLLELVDMSWTDLYRLLDKMEHEGLVKIKGERKNVKARIPGLSRVDKAMDVWLYTDRVRKDK